MTGLSWREAWTGALDELELDVVSVESLLADEHRGRDLPVTNPWSPPAGLGPLPLDLRPRADGILTRQLAAAQALAQALVHNRRHAAVAATVETGVPVGRPAYLDCAM